eukprot:10142533-Ditylum_brightwellii.AAC.1
MVPNMPPHSCYIMHTNDMVTHVNTGKLRQIQCDALNFEQPGYAPAMNAELKCSDLEYHPDDADTNRNKDLG